MMTTLTTTSSQLICSLLITFTTIGHLPQFGVLSLPDDDIGRCSRTKPCHDGSCCSKWGFCGLSDQFCGIGCLSNCDANKGDGAAIVEQECSKVKLCPEGACCSKWNFCGFSEEHCGNGCLSGPCIDRSLAINSNPVIRENETKRKQSIKVDGECSKNNPCSDGSCCSKYNFCGRTAQHCGPGCQSNCELPPPGAEEDDEEDCSLTKPCADGSCCSKWGHCGYGAEFCGVGCLSNCDSMQTAVPTTTECGHSATANSRYCPLNICCSQFGYCGITSEFCGVGCQSNCERPSRPSCPNAQTLPLRRVIGYFASWSLTPDRKCGVIPPESINPDTYTHIIVSFATIKDNQLTITESDRKLLQRFVALKQKNPQLKVMLAVGGWAFNDKPTHKVFTTTASNLRNRLIFVKSVVELLDSLQIDGLDIDWEYPVAEERGGEKQDKENYVLLLRELRRRFASRLTLSVAAPASYWYLRHFDIQQISEIVDWINVMTYDMHGVWDSPRSPYVLSHTNLTEIDTGLEIFYRAGVRPEKLNLGLAFYSRTFRLSNPVCTLPGCSFDGPGDAGPCTQSEGTLSYHEIARLLSDQPKLQPRLDKSSASKLLVWRDQWIGYDDPDTLRLKINYARSQCIGGVMVWSIDQDDSRTMSLEKALHDHAVKQPTTSSATPTRLKFPPPPPPPVRRTGVQPGKHRRYFFSRFFFPF